MIQLPLPTFNKEDLPNLYYRPKKKTKNKSYDLSRFSKKERKIIRQEFPLWFNDAQLTLPKMTRSTPSGTLIRKQKKILFAGRDKANCIYCKTPLKFKSATMDHIIPWSGGGSNKISNLLISCKQCNNQRKNMPFNRWICKLGLKIVMSSNYNDFDLQPF